MENGAAVQGRRTSVEVLTRLMEKISDRIRDDAGIKDAYPFMTPVSDRQFMLGLGERLMGNGIAFREVKGIPGLVIIDRSKAVIAKKEAVKILSGRVKGSYGRETTKRALAKYAGIDPGIKDRRLIGFHSLEPYVADIMQKEIWKIRPGIMTARETDRKGKTSLYILSGMVNGKEREKIAKSYLSALIRAYGLRNGINMDRPSAKDFFLVEAENTMVNGIHRFIRQRCSLSTSPELHDYFTIYSINVRYALGHIDGKGIDDPDNREQIKKATAYIDFMKADKDRYMGIPEIMASDGHSVTLQEESVPVMAAERPEADREVNSLEGE